MRKIYFAALLSSFMACATLAACSEEDAGTLNRPPQDDPQDPSGIEEDVPPSVETGEDALPEDDEVMDTAPEPDTTPDDDTPPELAEDFNDTEVDDVEGETNTDAPIEPDSGEEDFSEKDEGNDEDDADVQEETPELPVIETPEEIITIVKALEVTITSTSASISLDGKKVLFAGNSQIYYGKCVKKLSKDATASERVGDKGYFYSLANKNNETVTVYNYTIPNYWLNSVLTVIKKQLNEDKRKAIDYVILSSDAAEHSQLGSWVKDYVKAFPKSRIIFFAQEWSYYKGYASDEIKRVKDITDGTGKKIIIANWGEIVRKIYKHTWTVDPSSIKTTDFKRTSFIKNKGDERHPNPLSGYIQALTAYTAITQKSAVGMPYKFTYETKAAQKSLDDFETNHYKTSTNFIEILQSATTIKGIQKLVDKSNNYKPAASQSCKHQFSALGSTELKATANTNGVGRSHCSACNKDILVEYTSNLKTKKNVMQITKAEIAAAGVSTAKDYMLAGKGNVFYQTETGWGRRGYASIQGMASACDGVRASAQVTDGTQLYWKIKDMNKRYTATGAETGTLKYLSLIGYTYKTPVKASGFALFADTKTGSLTGFDVLGGKKTSSGYEWKVLWSGSAATYSKYDASTGYVSADFEETTLDAIQIGVTSAKSNILYISEFEVYGSI